MDSALRAQIEAIHATRVPIVVAITGGGITALSQLVAIPGGSQVLVEGVVPYDERSLAQWLGGSPTATYGGACCAATASAMAMAGYRRARKLRPDTPVAAVGATASLVTSRPKRGDHRVHVAWQTREASGVMSLVLTKGVRDRDAEEQLATELVLMAMAEATGAPVTLQPAAREEEQPERYVVYAPEKWQRLLAEEDPLEAVGFDPAARPLALLSGSFHPLHDGHRGMARVARQKLACPVVWELSIANVDKPPLDYLAITARTSQFGPDPYLLTRAPTFVEKARLLPGSTFVVGADTIERIGQPRYYGNSASARDAAIDQLTALGSRFLVFGRKRNNHFETLADLELPGPLRRLCDEVPESEFRHDISSTAIRQQEAE
jgi:nicotinamide mononucleotide (NMN) deamidase PncC